MDRNEKTAGRSFLGGPPTCGESCKNIVTSKNLFRSRYKGEDGKRRSCSAWPDHNPTQLDAMLRESWAYIRKHRGSERFGLDASLKVEAVPTNFEARRVTCGEASLGI